jgi:hypothetical protein
MKMAGLLICEQGARSGKGTQSCTAWRVRYRSALDLFPQRVIEHQRRRPPLLVSTNHVPHPSAAQQRRRVLFTRVTNSAESSAIIVSTTSG